jgi:putative oxidoreductase
MKTKLHDLGLLVMRLAIGAMMLTHAFPKLNILLEGKGSEWLDPIGIGPVFSLVLATGAELVGSLLIMVGFLTRISSLVLAVNMAVASFIFLSGNAFAQRELAVFYFAMYVALALLGPGNFSVSHAISGKSPQLKKLEDF